MAQEDIPMLFDYCVSNPPYQMDKSTGKNNTADNIFHLFYQYGIDFTHQVIMIFPGGRWMQRSSRGNKAAHVIYPTVNTIDWYPNGDEKNITKVFPGVIIHDGVCIVTGSHNIEKHNKLLLNGIEFDRPGEKDILPLNIDYSFLVKKTAHMFDKTINIRRYSRSAFGLRSYYSERNPDKLSKIQDEHYDTPVWMANSSKGTSKRVELFYIPHDEISWSADNEKVFYHYKVVASQASASKTPESCTYVVIDNNTAVGESWVVVGDFLTKEEAINYKKYLDTNVVKKLFSLSKGGKLMTWGYFIPDLEDYTSNNPHIDWSKPLDPQLYKLFHLTGDEIRTIENS